MADDLPPLQCRNVKKIWGLDLPGTPWATSGCCGKPLLFFILKLHQERFLVVVFYFKPKFLLEVIQRKSSLLLSWRYNSGRVLAFSTIPFHLRRFWTCSVLLMSFIFLRSFLTSSSHQNSGLPTGLPVNGFHLYIFFTILVSGILFMCPNQLNLWALT